jgi:hypothetical protein
VVLFFEISSAHFNYPCYCTGGHVSLRTAVKLCLAVSGFGSMLVQYVNILFLLFVRSTSRIDSIQSSSPERRILKLFNTSLITGLSLTRAMKLRIRLLVRILIVAGIFYTTCLVISYWKYRRTLFLPLSFGYARTRYYASGNHQASLIFAYGTHFVQRIQPPRKRWR